MYYFPFKVRSAIPFRQFLIFFFRDYTVCVKLFWRWELQFMAVMFVAWLKGFCVYGEFARHKKCVNLGVFELENKNDRKEWKEKSTHTENPQLIME